MSGVISGLIGGVFGVAIALISAWVAIRRTPSKTIFNAQTLAEASGLVVTNLTAEIGRLDRELVEERKALSDLLAQTKLCAAEIAGLRAEVEVRPTRLELFETNGKLRRQLIDLGETPANGPLTQ